jgi:hypothetical protein
MDKNALWTLAGVMLGWALNQATAFVRHRSDLRQQVGRDLAILITLRNELDRVRLHHETFKERVGSWADYEAHRSNAARTLLGKDVELESQLEGTIISVAGIDPMAALMLRKTKGMVLRYQELDLQALSLRPDSYIKVLSTMEVGYDIAVRALDRVVRSLAWKHGLGTFIKVAALTGRMKRLGDGMPFVQSMLDEAEGTAAKTL